MNEPTRTERNSGVYIGLPGMDRLLLIVNLARGNMEKSPTLPYVFWSSSIAGCSAASLIASVGASFYHSTSCILTAVLTGDSAFRLKRNGQH